MAFHPLIQADRPH